MATLPRPNVTVTTIEADGQASSTITVERDGKQRVWTGSGPIVPSATAEAVKKMLDDPITVEYVKESR